MLDRRAGLPGYYILIYLERLAVDQLPAELLTRHIHASTGAAQRYQGCEENGKEGRPKTGADWPGARARTTVAPLLGGGPPGEIFFLLQGYGSTTTVQV